MGRNAQPSATIFDSRTLQSSPKSGERAGSDGAKRRKGSEAHMVADALEHMLALVVTAADEQDRAQVTRSWRRQFKRQPAKPLKWPLWTRATLARRPNTPRRRRALAWKLSSCQLLSKASRSCHAAGSSKGPSARWLTFAVWHA